MEIKVPEIRELKPRIFVFGVGGAGGNAVNNMIAAGLQGVDFVVANTDAQHLMISKAERRIQLGAEVTEGLGAGSQPEIGRAAAEESIEEIKDHLNGAHMVFVTAGMGGGTGTGAAPVIARIAHEMGILTVGVVTKPFQFEGDRRMRFAQHGIEELSKNVDTLLVIPNQNLFRVANEKTTFADAFAMADQVLYSGVACITDLMVKEGLINLDFADVRSVMRAAGKAMMGTGEASGEKRAMNAAEAAVSNPLIDDSTMKGAKGLLVSITGGKDLTLYEVDEAATRIREEVDKEANIIVGATFDESLDGIIRVSVVATGIDQAGAAKALPASENRIGEVAQKLRRQPEPPMRPTSHAPEAIEQAATAAVAAALAPQPPQHHTPQPVAIDQVTIRPMPPKPSLFLEPEASEAPPAPEVPPTFIPPVPEHIARRPRMPRMEELPMPAQREIRARRGELPEHEHPEKQRMTLLKRLAAVGLGRRSEEAEEPARHVPPPMPARLDRIPPRPPSRPLENQRPVSDYAPRAPQGLDLHGRQSAVHNSPEDDQLEIPAFLRRQAN
jgi:cell division protein FtsZ